MSELSPIELLTGTLSASDTLSGNISVLNTLDGYLSIEESLNGSLSGEILPNPYLGPYTVVPSVETQIHLNTQSKSMYSDVTVEKVPYRVNDNLSDGLTVYIGD